MRRSGKTAVMERKVSEMLDRGQKIVVLNLSGPTLLLPFPKNKPARESHTPPDPVTHSDG